MNFLQIVAEVNRRTAKLEAAREAIEGTFHQDYQEGCTLGDLVGALSKIKIHTNEDLHLLLVNMIAGSNDAETGKTKTEGSESGSKAKQEQ